MRVDTVVIGAGPAGLATSAALTRAAVPHVVLERGAQVGASWANFYDSLVLHTARRLSALPGLRFPAGTPRYPTRGQFVSYLEAYAAAFRAPVETGADVTSIARAGGAWRLRTAAGRDVEARAIVVATGIAANPVVPVLPGRGTFSGRVLHSVDYRRPGPFAGARVLVVGARVLVVGAGNSAGEIAAELAQAGVRVTLAATPAAPPAPSPRTSEENLGGFPPRFSSEVGNGRSRDGR